MKFSEFKTTGAYVAPEVLERVHKCTTAEEVEKLAMEYDLELTAEEISEILKYNSIKELNGEQLDQIFGGAGVDITEHLPSNHGPWIGKYEAQGHIGERVFCVRDTDPKQFCWGILVNSEEYTEAWWSYRIHNILIQGWNHTSDQLNVRYRGCPLCNKRVPINEILSNISGDDCTLFLYNK